MNTNTTTEVAEELSETNVEQQTTVDQRTIPVATGYLDGSNALPASESIAEDEFSHIDILKQPIKLASFTWSTSQINDDLIHSFYVPDILNSLPTIHRQMLQTYAFMKLALRFRIVLNTTKFHSGKLIVNYVPFNITVAAIDRLPGAFTASGMPHVILDAGDSNSAELNVPFEHILTYLTTNSPEVAPAMGQLRFEVLNALRTSTGGTDPITVNVFVSAASIDLHIPMRPHTVAFSVASPVESNINLKDITKTVGGVAKTATGAIADLKSGNFKGLLSTAKDFFSLDRPASIDTRQGNCLATISAPCHMLGLDQAVRMGATQDGSYTITDFSTAPASDMQIENIITKPMIFERFVWQTTDAEDALLATIPVTPGLCQWTPVEFTPGGTQYLRQNPTFLSYFAAMHEFWRGGITFTFDFAATQFHSGRLMFVFEPNGTTTPLSGVGATVSDFSNNPNLVFDLRESKKVSFSVPFNSSTPRKRCVPSQWVATPPASDIDVLGYLRILVLSPLTVAENMPLTVEFNGWVSASPNFKFYAPRVRSSTFFFENAPQLPPENSDDIVYTNSGDDTILRETQPSKPILKTNSQLPTPNYFGEEVNDVRDLARRYSRYHTSQTMTADPTRSGVVNAKTSFGAHPDLYYAANFVSNVPNSAQSFATMISRLYALWSGSIRWKFVPLTDRTKTLQLVTSYFYNDETDQEPTSTGNYSAYPLVVTNAPQDTAQELELPFYSLYAQNLCQNDVGGAFRDGIYTPGYIQLECSSTPSTFADDHVAITAFHAIGDDFAFRFLVSPPALYDEFITP